MVRVLSLLHRINPSPSSSRCSDTVRTRLVIRSLLSRSNPISAAGWTRAVFCYNPAQRTHGKGRKAAAPIEKRSWNLSPLHHRTHGPFSSPHRDPRDFAASPRAAMMANRAGAVAGDTGSPSARAAAAAAGEEEAGLPKVKLLCSFAGRIAPRSGDGALRYVGGQTRLISVPRAASFGELMRKVEAVDEGASAAAGGVLVKYQLPGEDLDSLISVACAEDYVNMLEEYEKLAAAAPDGSAKLRVFLFPASGSEAAASGSGSHLAVDESGQRYIDAINCVSADAVAAIRRKETSVASAGSSAHNSEASEQGGVVEGMSPRAVPPHSVPPEYLYSAGSHSNHGSAFPQSLGFSAVAAPAPAVGIPAQNPVLVRAEPSPLQPHQAASYAPSHQPAQVSSYVPHRQPAQVASYAPLPQVASYAPPLQPQVASHVPLQQPQVASYAQPQLPQGASYTAQMPQSHIEPQQVQYINAQQFGQHGTSQSANLIPVQMSQYVPSTLRPNSMATPATQIGTLRPVSAGTERVQENLHFTRPMHTPVDPNYRVPQPLSQLPPLLHMTLQTSDAQTHGVQTVVTSTVSSPVSASSGTFPGVVSSATVPAVRYDDCTMCQKILPHAHSDNMIKDQGNPRAANYPDATPVFYSLHQQNATNQHFTGSAATPANYMAEPRAESKAGMAHYDQIHSARNPAVQATPSPATGAVVQPTMVTLPVSSAPTSTGVFVGHPPYSRAEDHFTYQHPQQHIYGMQPSQVLVNGVVLIFICIMVQDARNKESDKTSQGVPILDDIDNLQIIKNSDLEELRELGSGTFGTVYHGKWRGSDVAIKRISDRCFAGKASEEQRMKTDFWNEACKLASLHHPNVVAFYGVVLDGPGGSVATVTEYMANGSLRQALQRHEKIFDRRRRLLIVMDVAFGMEYLHGKNIVHFDLKSDNLLVNLRDPQRPICKVGDLGLSKVKCQTLISGGVRGTLPWMAPELLNGSSNLVSEKVDVFSFGIVMWELLTGEEPYADLHYGAIIGGIVNNTLRPLVPESCDPQWRSLMEQCWSAEPSERPSFTEVVKRLRAMATSPTKAQPQK
uniref:Uncharacterized protein n=1 Tax=Avena sativa TaxID=4498 RepID=A0ACD5ZTV3_AVESA